MIETAVDFLSGLLFLVTVFFIYILHALCLLMDVIKSSYYQKQTLLQCNRLLIA